MLAPAAASSRLLALGSRLSLDGITSITLPFVGGQGRPVGPFVAEGGPIPVFDLVTGGAVLGPARKICNCGYRGANRGPRPGHIRGRRDGRGPVQR